jgi:hypothetical protein
LCKNAKSETEINAEKADGVVRNLIERANPLLTVIGQLLPPGNIIRNAAFDEVSLCALDCIIDFVNKTRKMQIFLDILKIIQPMAASKTIQTRIETNINTAKQESEYEHAYSTCWFCGKNRPTDLAGMGVDMHGEITRDYMSNRVQWKYRTINVPRCLPCRDVHKKPTEEDRLFLCQLVGYIPSAIVIIRLIIGTYHDDKAIVGIIIIGALLAQIPANLIGKLLYSIYRKIYPPKKTDIKPEKDRYNFPDIVKLKNNGWAYGEQPPNVQ